MTNDSSTSSVSTPSVSGVVVIDKPPRVTSSGVVTRLKGVLRRLKLAKVKVGHAGTLDPFATGVLLILIGSATKKAESLMNSPKQYEATIKLGCTTETDDPESPEVVTPDAMRIDVETLRAALQTQVGEIDQMPPLYSALKIAGKRASDRVRLGQPVELASRRVHIYSIELLDYEWPIARVRVDCGRGTYVRAIARDIGKALGVGAYLLELRRTRVGEYDVANALKPDELTPQWLRDVLSIELKG